MTTAEPRVRDASAGIRTTGPYPSAPRSAEDLAARTDDAAGTYLTERVRGHELLSQPALRLARVLYGLPDLRPVRIQDENFARWRSTGDPLADALVARIKSGGGRELRAQFEQALADGITAVEDPPAELAEFFRAAENVPYWADPEKLERGSRVYQSVGADIMPVFAMGLAMSYLAEDANRVLLRSGDLSRNAARRAVETLTWVGEVTTPGALYPGGDGYRAVLRVRLTHGFMRSGIGQTPGWPESELPIHQGVYVATPILFSVMTMALDLVHGHFMTRRDRAAVLHLWRYIACLVGVAPELVAADEPDQWRLAAVQMNHQIRLDDVTRASGRELGGALLRAYPELFGLDPRNPREARALGRVTAANTLIMHLLLGEKAATTLGFDNPALTALPSVVWHAAVNVLRRAAAYAVPGGRRRYEDRQRAVAREVLVTAGRRARADLTYHRTGGTGQ